MAIQSINPANGATLAEFDDFDDAKVEACLARAAETFEKYRRTSFAQRATRLHKAGDILEGEAEALARMMVEEMGKPFNAAVAEAQKCAWVCRYYADNGAQLLADETIETAGSHTCRHALELPVLAGVPLRRHGADGGQRGAAQVRLERAPVRLGHRTGAATSRLCRRRFPDAADRLVAGR